LSATGNPVVPNGDSLCASEISGADAELHASRYSVPAGTAVGVATVHAGRFNPFSRTDRLRR
jgi:hypothetical protein